MYNYSENSRLIRVAILGAFIPAVLFLLFSFFISNRTLEIERLKAVAELSSETIREQLLQPGLKDINGKIESFSKDFSLDGLELYRSDGSVLATKGSRDVQTNAFVIGDDTSYSWPFTFRFQHSKLFLYDGRPLGFLILYSSLNKKASTWMVWGFVITLLITAALVYTLRLQKYVGGAGESSGFRFENNKVKIQSSSRHIAVEGYCDKPQDQSLALETLCQERDRAVASAKAKGDFLANMSHEIRTSMNGVIGILSILQKPGLKSERRRLLDAAARSADSLLLIINDILDFSKIESGKIDFESIEFDLRQVIEESITLYIDTASAKKIGLHCYIPLEINTKVVGDPTRLRQILTNLLSNAVKFTHAGEVNLGVTALETTAGRQRLQFTVDDTGIGIAPEKLDNVFDMFTQAEQTTTREFGGTGLGLNICKQLVELQNGKIGVSSRYGQSTSFWFSLDFAVSNTGTEIFVGQQELERKKVILFDSCETCTTIISQYLKESWVKVRAGDNPDDIIQQLQDILQTGFVPDVLLVNYPAIVNRISIFVEQVSLLFPNNKPQLMALSWRDGTEEKLKRKGFSATVYKPVQLRQLREELLGRHESDTDQNLLEAVETLSGRVLLVDDERINLHVGEMILSKIGFDVDVAVSGEQALQMTANNHYDIVMMDVQMPGFSGLDVTQTIRQREKEFGEDRRVIIAVTANVLASIKQRCLEAGMDDFISKPIKPDLLISHLRPWLNGREAESAHDAEKTTVPQQESLDVNKEYNETVWDRQLALEYLGGDENLLNDLVKLFLQRKNILLDAIEKAMTDADGEEISCAAHAFKGAVNHFAAKRCQKIAQLIEDMARDGLLEDLNTQFNTLKIEADALEEDLRKSV